MIMDPEAFLDLANQVAKLKMYPYFDIAHAVVCCLALKEDMGSGKPIVIFFHALGSSIFFEWP